MNNNYDFNSVLTIDLGGTKIASAIISDGKILSRGYRLTNASTGPDAVISRLYDAIDELLEKETPRPTTIAIACAGVIDMVQGVVTVSPNLPGWHNIPLRRLVVEKFGLKTFLLNDASSAVLAEQCYGAAKDYSNCVYITVSTGIGGGIIIDGQLYLGASGAAGEIGHSTIDVNGPLCYCGNYGCLEVLASGSAIARDTIARLKTGAGSRLGADFTDRLESITAKDVHHAAKSGDKLALEIISKAAGYLGVGIVNTVHIFNPDIIIMGGSVTKMGQLIFQPVEKAVAKQAFPLSARAIKIVPALLGDDSGLIGAALYAVNKDT
jgi:glucokinase